LFSSTQSAFVSLTILTMVIHSSMLDPERLAMTTPSSLMRSLAALMSFM